MIFFINSVTKTRRLVFAFPMLPRNFTEAKFRRTKNRRTKTHWSL